MSKVYSNAPLLVMSGFGKDGQEEEKGGEALKRFFDERDVFRQKMMSKHSDLSLIHI